MAGANNEQIRSVPDGEHAAEIEKEKQWNKQPNVEQLIGPGASVKNPIGVVTRPYYARANQPHVVNKKEPDHSRISGAQLKPRQRAIEPAEKNGFTERASDIEKIMSKLQGPFDQRERVND